MIRLENVSYCYPDGTPALTNINLTIRKGGEYLGIIGRNGSGKSTLALHLNGLRRPQKGKVIVKASTPETFQSFRRSGKLLESYFKTLKPSLLAGL